jgi:hypothetical protein
MTLHPNKRRIAIGLLILIVLVAASVFFLKGNAFYMLSHHMSGGDHMHGADGTGHDEINMPGLRGANATPEESAELAVRYCQTNETTHHIASAA